MKIALATALLALAAGASAQDRPDLRVTRTAQPPVIDGVLDDDAWRAPAMDLGAWVSYNPLRGDTMPGDFRTEVRITYDARNLYLAFHCFDNEADKIRTTITRRDSAFNDDWIAMSLDSAGTGQSAYHLFVNPSGSQMDALNTSASGEQFDADFIWYSVGKRTADGYIVEVSLPLQSLRFSSGNDVRMGILFFRKISRLGVSYSWPDMPSGQWVFDRNARLLFESLNQPRLVEALPSATYGVSQTRPSSGDWDPANDKADFGLSGKFGITSNITLDGTINPDFSQVESDAYQIEVNQRFPIFYSEKRPFFMEGMGLFNIAGTEGDSNMRTAVHTRRIVNPFWGSKVTGTAGKTTFGVLNASDERPEDIGNRGFDFTERDKLFTIARVTRAFTGSDYAGAILTDTRHAGRSNTVAGADVAVKFSPPQQFSATVLFSQTSADGIDTQGPAAQMSYSYQTRRFNWSNQIEHYDRAFQMDTAFYNRTGFTDGLVIRRGEFLSAVGNQLLAAPRAPLRLHEVRARRGAGRRRGVREHRHPSEFHQAGLLQPRLQPRPRAVARHALHHRPRFQRVRRDADRALAPGQRRRQSRPRNFLRPRRAIPGALRELVVRADVPAEPALHAGGRHDQRAL